MNHAPSPALSRIRVPMPTPSHPAQPSASETVQLTAEQMKAEMARLRSPTVAEAPERTGLKLYVLLGLGAALLAAAAFVIANPQLPEPPPAPKPVSGMVGN